MWMFLIVFSAASIQARRMNSKTRLLPELGLFLFPPVEADGQTGANWPSIPHSITRLMSLLTSQLDSTTSGRTAGSNPSFLPSLEQFAACPPAQKHAIVSLLEYPYALPPLFLAVPLIAATLASLSDHRKQPVGVLLLVLAPTNVQSEEDSLWLVSFLLLDLDKLALAGTLSTN
jgi:hypothetical protein